MDQRQIKKIVIVGGGTAGWMAAAALSERYKDFDLHIELVESDDIPTVGVGEATVPGIIKFHQHLGIRESEFIRATGATFKLGIEFKDWVTRGESFFHPFASYGVPIAGQSFYQCWLKARQEGYQAPLQDFCLATAMAYQNRFAQPDDDATTPLALYSYAYHFDAGLYAQYLRKYAEVRGVVRTEGKVIGVRQHPDSGAIAAVQMESGNSIDGDFFVDCTGFRGLLIEKALRTGYDDWSRWLPCDSAVAMQTENTGEPVPFTRSTARSGGWQWRIPLRHRQGNGYVYCSQYLSDTEAIDTLVNTVEGSAINEPRIIRFTAGMRNRFWNKNCVALGLASGFIEPLESTSISLIQTGIEKLMQHLPELVPDEKQTAEANRLNRLEYERIRDFIILHYKASQREDSEFWRNVRQMDVPQPLAEKIEAFRKDGTLLRYEQESFADQSWLSMYNGFRIVPQSLAPEAEKLDGQQLMAVMEKMRSAIAAGVQHAPPHSEFLAGVYGD